MDVRFVDTTLRDGSQSLWASGIRTGMIEAVAESMAQAGFAVVEVPVVGIYMKKFVRDFKENPWEMARMVARKMPDTVKSCMASGNVYAFDAIPPRSLVELFFTRVVETGGLNRVQLMSNTADQSKRDFPWVIPMFKKLGVKVVPALCYTISPRHSDAYFAQKTRDVLAFKPDAIYLKDQGGLLTVDRIRTLIPTILENANGVPVELHSHCTTGMADLVYLEALRLGVRTLHTAIPPLANGSGQPSVFTVARNARLLGFSPSVDESVARAVSDRLMAIAKQEKLPIGAPLEYDHGQYVHQVPGGVISNLRYQLIEMRLQHRLDEVLDESVRVREDLGYPIMITPYSQFVVTQAAINVATGERYKHVIDELIRFAQGEFGEDSGFDSMDQTLKDRLVNMSRAAELAARKKPNLSMKDIRDQFGGSGVSDEEFLLRYIMKNEQEVAAMYAAGPPKLYLDTTVPLLTLIKELQKHKGIGYVRVQHGGDSLVLQNRSPA